MQKLQIRLIFFLQTKIVEIFYEGNFIPQAYTKNGESSYTSGSEKNKHDQFVIIGVV